MLFRSACINGRDSISRSPTEGLTAALCDGVEPVTIPRTPKPGPVSCWYSTISPTAPRVTVSGFVVLFIGVKPESTTISIGAPKLGISTPHVYLRIAASLWILTELLPWPCPLTLLENYLEARAGIEPYQGRFLLHYLDRLVYPNVSATALTVAGVIVCAFNLIL